MIRISHARSLGSLEAPAVAEALAVQEAMAGQAEGAEKKVFPLAAETAGKRKASLHFVPLG